MSLNDMVIINQRRTARREHLRLALARVREVFTCECGCRRHSGGLSDHCCYGCGAQ